MSTANFRILVTCGPASEPIDEVRGITNFSTGELGSLLSDHLAASQQENCEVFCLRGVAATFPPPRHAQILSFSTNADLEKRLQQLASCKVVALFHMAALCDFYLAGIENTQGIPITPSSKLSSEYEELRLILARAPKIIQRLRTWFPHSKIVGWKYELEGSVDDALASGWEQIQMNKTDACVVNGRACGNQFTFLEKDVKNPIILPTKPELCEHLKNWLSAHIGSSTEN